MIKRAKARMQAYENNKKFIEEKLLFANKGMSDLQNEKIANQTNVNQEISNLEGIIVSL
jgi:hypothetical protein